MASRFSIEKFLSYKAEKFRKGTLSFSLIPRIGKSFASKGCHDFLSNVFCLSVPKKSVEEPFCAVFQNISGDEKDYGKEWGGVWSYQDFPSNVFCLRVPEIFVGEIFCAVFRKVSGSEEVYVVEKRGIKIFRQIVFVSQCRNLSQRNHLCCVSEHFR